MIWPFAPQTFLIRALGPGDARPVAAIHGEGFAIGWPASDVERMLADPAIVSDGAATLGWPSQIVGFVMSRVAADEAEILSIGVRRKRQGAGVAGRLLAHHLSHLGARGVRALFLEVEEGNAPAIALYLRFGFEKVGERPGYYRKPDGRTSHAVVMRRDLG